MNGAMADRNASDRAQTSTIVGIDEAGYGPLLGPLVVSAAAFDVPVPILKQLERPADGPDLWNILRASVKKTAGRRDPRLAVADSKKLYGKARCGGGIALLERAALTFLRQAGAVPATLRGLLGRLCPQVMDQLDHYPWYAGAGPDLPVQCSRDDLATQHNALSSDLRATGVRFRGAWVEVLPEGHFNRLVGVTHNKAVVLFGMSVRLVQRIADAVGRRPLRVWIDRQGGRIGYRQPLMTAFDDARLEVLEESPGRSSYRLTRRPAPWVIRFVRDGETHHLPVALASIFSKYIRELFMTCLNRYWCTQVAGLRPTAGYYQDGRRFLEDIRGEIARQGVDRQWLVRSC